MKDRYYTPGVGNVYVSDTPIRKMSKDQLIRLINDTRIFTKPDRESTKRLHSMTKMKLAKIARSIFR